MLRVLLSLILFAASPFAHAQSMPGPWPFPWAKDCPVRWETLEGRYLLPESTSNPQLDVKVTVVDKLNFKLVRVSRYAQDGRLEADGYVWVSANQRTIRLWLNSLREGEPPTWAVLKLHFASAERVCNADHLVAILTLDQSASRTHPQSQYRLIKLEGRRN